MKTLFAFALLLTTIQGSALYDFTKGNQLFTADIYKEYKKSTKDNFLLSPFSIQVVLALTQSGAKDDTAQEIRTHLHLPDSDQATKSAIGTYFKSVKSSEKYQLHSANKIYVSKTFSITNLFKKVAEEDYKADAENIDFSQSGKASGTINEWVEKQTENKIRNIVSAEDFSVETALVLINALYFRARWMIEFYRHGTKKGDFYKTDTDVVKTDLMYNIAWFNYYDSKELKAKFLELPFQDGDVSFVIVLPDEKNGLAALEQKSEIFQKQPFINENIHVVLPKFKLEGAIDFVENLKQLGITKIFSGEADLSGIGGKKGDLVVGKVFQKTFIDVTETGVEAAAATFVGFLTSMSLYSSPPIDFIVDHPFIFYIKAKDVVLFVGRVVDPSK